MTEKSDGFLFGRNQSGRDARSIIGTGSRALRRDGPARSAAPAAFVSYRAERLRYPLRARCFALKIGRVTVP